VAKEAHCLSLPVNFLGCERGHVGLRATQVPAEFVERPALRVLFVFDIGLVLLLRNLGSGVQCAKIRRGSLPGDCPFFLETSGQPLLLGEDRPGQPVHAKGEIVNPPQINIRRDGSQFQRLQKMRCLGFQNRQIADEVKCFILHRHYMTGVRRSRFVPGHLVHRYLPGALGNFGVGGSQVSSGDLEIQEGLAVNFVPRMKDDQGFSFVLGAQAGLFAGLRVFAVKDARSINQIKTWFHNWTVQRSSGFVEVENV